MKPLGPIPQGYGAIDGELAIDGRKASDLVAQAQGQTPLFVYSKALMAQRVAQLRKAMPERLAIHYAIKANPHPAVVQFMGGLVDGCDVASRGELELALEQSIAPERISFAGPGKRDEEIVAALRHGVTLNCESAGEAHRTMALAREIECRPKIAIRVNPNFELRGSGMKMGGGAKPFGVDEDQVPMLARELIESGADFRGLHIFTGSQALDCEAVIETQANVLNLADKLATHIGVPLPTLNMGGGFGIPYFHGDRPLDIGAIGRALEQRLAALPPSLRDAQLSIELGRYLVGEAGVYLCRIVDRKVSHGRVFLVTDGGLHHQLAASGNFGTVVRRNYPVAIASKFARPPEEEANVVGCLCTPLDRLADQAHLPRAEVGDLVAVFCAGAYGASASPAAFLGHGPAREILI